MGVNAGRRTEERWRPRPAGILALLVALLLVGWTLPAVAAGEVEVERARRVLEDRMAAVGIPGAALVVTSAGGPTAVEALGEAGEDRPVASDTPFVIGSTSKSFTALAVMQLVDDGLVDIDQPVRRYVPELELAGAGDVDRITVRHLLQQTSGLPGTAGGPVLKSAREGSVLEAVRELRGTAPTAEPGATWQYSNANYVLAGLVVERAAGVPYAEHVERRILEPLGMDRSATTAEGAAELGVSTGHRLWFGATLATGPTVREGILAAGFIVSTAEDMGRYLRMHLRGGVGDDGTRVVSAEGLRTMTAPGPEARLGAWADGADVRYAMGWFVGGPWQEPALLHPGNTPDSSAMITLLPERAIAIATLMNLSNEIPVPGNPSATDRVSRNVVDAILGEPVDTGPSVRTFYALLDLVFLALVAAAAWGLARAVAALRGGRPVRRPLLTGGGIGLRLVGVGVLLALPGAAGYGWSSLPVWAPDLAVVVTVLAGLLLAAAAVRLAVLLRAGPVGFATWRRSSSGSGSSPASRST
ncbi:MAG TPA: serine hydrolase domain-containing protein [Jiangellales bacterium]|nr:serine hydrolase domain-containing protein [Jiangellales bacterium]